MRTEAILDIYVYFCLAIAFSPAEVIVSSEFHQIITFNSNTVATTPAAFIHFLKFFHNIYFWLNFHFQWYHTLITRNNLVGEIGNMQLNSV